MALADNVLVDGNTFSDLASRKVPPGALTYRFKYKPEALERPIMRSTDPNGSLSESRVLTYDTFNCALKGLGQRAGYEENLSAYCFRRAFARSIFSKGICCTHDRRLTVYRYGHCSTTAVAHEPHRRQNHRVLHVGHRWCRHAVNDTREATAHTVHGKAHIYVRQSAAKCAPASGRPTY